MSGLRGTCEGNRPSHHRRIVIQITRACWFVDSTLFVSLEEEMKTQKIEGRIDAVNLCREISRDRFRSTVMREQRIGDTQTQIPRGLEER
jgi:hypothetical protein